MLDILKNLNQVYQKPFDIDKLFDTVFYLLSSVDEKHIKMTEDHRIISSSERQRFQATGEPLKDGETRLCGT